MDNPILWTFLLLQIFMGGLDTVYHHEFTERLAWRKNQQRELLLHGSRNWIYGLFFLLIGFFEPHGLFAIALMAALLAEMVITLIDFVEEDRTRALPWTERILHTLLTLNYGVLLALLMPVLLAFAAPPSAMAPAFYGWISLLMIPAAIGVAVFGTRDILASRRLARLAPRPAASLAGALRARERILITGGTGFIGSRLVEALATAGHDVTVLTRNSRTAAGLATPVRIVTSLRQITADETFDAIINLAGKPVISGLWTARFRRRTLFSRLRLAAEIRRLVMRLRVKPPVVLTASAIGFYGLKNDEVLTEYSRIGNDGSFSHRSCAAVERHAIRLRRLGVRVVTLRIGLVLDPAGGVLGNMLFPFEYGLGGRFGTGKQWMSWISRDDTVRLICHAIAREEIEGPLNLTAPTPVRNQEFANGLGRALQRPALIPIPAFVLLAAGDLGREIFLGGQRVLPTRALETGFQFLDPALDAALQQQLTGAPSPADATGARGFGVSPAGFAK